MVLRHLEGELRGERDIDLPDSLQHEEITLPEPAAEIVEVYRILTEHGFDVAQIAYVNRGKLEVTHAVIEKIPRPDCTDGTQMYYPEPDKKEDPLAHILEVGRREGNIDVPVLVEHVPASSRFGISWDEVHNFVVPRVVSTVPGLAEVISRGRIISRVPTRVEFQFAGTTHPGFVAASWEQLYNDSGFGYRLLGGSRAVGGLASFFDWLSGNHDDNVAFRLQWSSPPQKLP